MNILIIYILVGWLLGVTGYLVTKDSEAAIGLALAWPIVIPISILVSAVQFTIKFLDRK
jgi:hypothetical protein